MVRGKVYMGIFLEGLLLYGCVFRGLTAIRAQFYRPYTYHESLGMGSCEPPVAPGLKSLTYECHWVLLQHHYGSILLFLLKLQPTHPGKNLWSRPPPRATVPIFSASFRQLLLEKLYYIAVGYSRWL